MKLAVVSMVLTLIDWESLQESKLAKSVLNNSSLWSSARRPSTLFILCHQTTLRLWCQRQVSLRTTTTSLPSFHQPNAVMPSTTSSTRRVTRASATKFAFSLGACLGSFLTHVTGRLMSPRWNRRCCTLHRRMLSVKHWSASPPRSRAQTWVKFRMKPCLKRYRVLLSKKHKWIS